MTRNRRNRRADYTMLEMMVVLAIIALIAGLASPRLMDSFGGAKSKTAEIQLGTMKSAVQLFYLDVGRYPAEAEGLDALLQAPSGAKNRRGPYLDDVAALNDPWVHCYLFHAPGSINPFEIWSYGHNGKEDCSHEDSDISL